MSILSRLSAKAAEYDEDFETSMLNAIDLRESEPQEPTEHQDSQSPQMILHHPDLNILASIGVGTQSTIDNLNAVIDNMNKDIIAIQTEKDSMISERRECIRQATIVRDAMIDSISKYKEGGAKIQDATVTIEETVNPMDEARFVS